MKRLFSKRWFKLSAGLALTLPAVTLAGASYYRVWGWRDLQAYQGMSRECHLVWRELHWGRIRAGQDVEQVIAETRPPRVERYGEFVRLNYQQGMHFTGVTITAKNGRVASAAVWSCAWGREFFDELTPDDWKAYFAAYEAHWQPIRKRQAEARPRRRVGPGGQVGFLRFVAHPAPPAGSGCGSGRRAPPPVARPSSRRPFVTTTTTEGSRPRSDRTRPRAPPDAEGL